MTVYFVRMAVIGGLFVASLALAPLPDVPLDGPKPTVYPATMPALAPTVPVAAPKPPPATTVPPTPRTCSEWAEYGRRYGWPETEIGTLTVIMGRESGCRPEAVGDNGASRGLLQLHCPTWVAPSKHWPIGWAAANGYPITCDDLHDPDTNLAIGFLIWSGVEGSGGGWWNWTTYTP